MKDVGVNIEFQHPAVGQEKEQFGLMLLQDKRRQRWINSLSED